MRKFRTPLLLLTAATISACGSNFEWFPKNSTNSATTVPAITTTVGGVRFKNTSTIHVSVLPAPIVFSSTGAVTIYYTTNGNDPTGSPNQVQLNIGSNGSAVTGASITVTNTILKFLGVATSTVNGTTVTAQSQVESGTIVSP